MKWLVLLLLAKDGGIRLNQGERIDFGTGTRDYFTVVPVTKIVSFGPLRVEPNPDGTFVVRVFDSTKVKIVSEK